MSSVRMLMLLGALVPGLAAASHGAPLATPASFTPPAGLEQAAIASAIRQGVGACRWQVSFERHGYVEALFERKALLIRVGLLYDSQQVRMIYLDNHGYHYHVEDDGTVIVHKKLNAMLDQLDRCVHTALGIATTAPAVRPADAPAAPPAETDPKDSDDPN